jgi:chlorobactene glucosyltransferase
MPVLLCGLVWAGLVGYLLFRALRQFRAFRATALPPPSNPAVTAVSIIVPARNEIDNIARCLHGLTQQQGLAAGSSIIVVDDGSEDGTAAAVEQHVAGALPISLSAAGPLPEGWVGKPHACWRGASRAKAAWLCFVDADVRAAPQLVVAAIAAAEAQQIDMLSLHPFQRLGSFWEQLVIPAGLLIVACAQKWRAPGEPRAAAAGANGQFILIRREVYFALGGHAAVAAEICEDRVLAIRAECAGFRFRALAAERFATTRMYRDLKSLWEGLSKNAVDILGSSAMTLAAAVTGMCVGWTALWLPFVAAVVIFRRPSTSELIGFGLTLAGSAVVIAVQSGTARHFRIPAVFGLMMPCGYTAAALLACHSLLLRRGKGVTWKGRTYDFDQRAPAGRS